jgi:hypothetical protein
MNAVELEKRILNDIEQRILSAQDEARRMAHIKDREIVRHHFMAAEVRLPEPICRKRIFAVNAAGGCMMQADGTV